MSIADRQHTAAVRRLSAAVTPALRWLAIRWDVRDGDLRGVLEWRIAEDHGRRAASPAAVAIWQHESAAAGVVVATVSAADARLVIRTSDAAGLEHIDIPGQLALTVHRDAGTGAAAVLYARTPLLAGLGARGGRIDCPTAAVLQTAHDPGAPPLRTGQETKHPAHVP